MHKLEDSCRLLREFGKNETTLWLFLASDKTGKAGEAPTCKPISCTKAKFVPNRDMEFSMTEMFFLGSTNPKI